jgi:hypothetical protein
MPLTTPKVNYDLIRLNGGLDQVTPTLSLPPGVARRAANFECSITGGYTRIAGYERFDGRPSPSAAVYNILVCALTGTVAVGDTIVGLASGASGRVIARAGNEVIITRETSVFVTGEALTVSSTNVGVITYVQGISADGLLDVTYRNLVADNYRADITVVPGSGAVLGVGVARLVGEATGWSTPITAGSILLAMGFSAAVGVFFGWFPARRAAALDPIDALRFQ